MAGSRVGLFDNLNIPIHRDAQHREDLGNSETRNLEFGGPLGSDPKGVLGNSETRNLESGDPLDLDPGGALGPRKLGNSFTAAGKAGRSDEGAEVDRGTDGDAFSWICHLAGLH